MWALAALLVLLVLAPLPASSAQDPEARLDVRITDVGPSVLRQGATVTLAGTVTNTGDEQWTDTQAYLVAPRTPFTTREQITDAVRSGTSYTGERRVELDSIDEIGTLAAGETREFRVRVPYSVLSINGAEGVYPVGVQILGTAEDGSRSGTAIGRATTFLPLVDDADPAPTGVVVPFVTPDQRGNGSADPGSLADLTASGGQLRRLLDLAEEVPSEGLTVMVDPALLVALDEIATADDEDEDDARPDEDSGLTDQQRADAGQFRDDLITLARRSTSWVLGYARPDVLGISEYGSQAITTAVDRATTAALERFGLSGRQVVWPTSNGVTDDLVRAVRGNGERPVLVSRAAVPEWEPRLGSIVTRPTDDGPVPLLVNSGLDAGVPGDLTVATLRQRLLAEAALGALDRSADPESGSDAVAVIDPLWNPGGGNAATRIADTFSPDFVDATNLDELMTDERAAYTGSMPSTASADAIPRAQVQEVDAAVTATSSLVALMPDGTRLENAQATRAAELVSIAWRKQPDDGIAAARAFSRATDRTVGSITVEGPPAVTLSSSEGSFPITVTNGTDEAIRVGLRLTSTNPRLNVPDVEPVEVAAGERRTLTVGATVGDQSSSTFTATLISADGQTFGEPAVFNVRSSRVGIAVWVAMGAAAVFVVLALARRFVTRRGKGTDDDIDASRPEDATTDTDESNQHV